MNILPTMPTVPSMPMNEKNATNPPTEPAVLHESVIDWFDEHARDLPGGAPKRAPGA